MASGNTLNIPRSPFVDVTTGNVNQEWLLWLLNLNVQSINLATALPTTSGGTGSSLTPTIGQLLIGDGSGKFVLTNDVPASSGGTGNNTYVVGDILYADTATTLARLPAGTLGYSLASNGPATAPSYQALGLPTIANLTILSNIFGSAALPVGNTLTAVLDAILGSTQGQLITRNAGGWTVLNPSTGGKVLTENGPGANLAWATPSGGLTNPMTTAGDLIVGGTAGAPTRLAVGAEGSGLVIANGSETWARGGQMPLLFYVPGASHAYSTSLLNPQYFGPLFDVVNSSAITTSIYPSGKTTLADQTAMLSAAGGGNLTVNTWYDQANTGGTVGMVQSTNSKRPLICLSGSVINFPGTVSGVPSIRFDGATQWLDSPYSTIAQPFTRLHVLRFISVASGQNISSDGATNSLYFSASGTISSYAGSTGNIQAGIATGALAIVIEVFNGGASRWYYNSANGTYTPGTNSSTKNSIGASNAGAAGSFANIECTDQIIWPRAMGGYEVAMLIDIVKALRGTP